MTDPRVLISSLRIRASSLRKVDTLAAERDWSRTEALRYLLRCGLAAHEKEHGPITPAPGARPRPEKSTATAAHTTQFDEATWRKLQKRGRQ